MKIFSKIILLVIITLILATSSIEYVGKSRNKRTAAKATTRVIFIGSYSLRSYYPTNIEVKFDENLTKSAISIKGCN